MNGQSSTEIGPEEGQPEGPDLPEDMTRIHEQIRSMSQGTFSEHDIPEMSRSTNSPESNNPPPLEPILEEAPPSSNAEGSIMQPEPESEGPITEPTETSNDEAEEEDPSLAVINLVCPDTLDVPRVPDMDQCAWRCEFDVELPCPRHEHVPDEAESWVLLATSAKKQRTEVRLSELSKTKRTNLQPQKTPRFKIGSKQVP